MKTLRIFSILALLSVTSPALGADDDLPEYTGPQFQSLYEYAAANSLPDLDAPNGRYPITGDEDVDQRIWELALDRGYVFRPTASGELASVAGVPMQAAAAESWMALRAEARRAGLSFTVSSAYRSPESQRFQFLSKLAGTSDDAIDTALTWYSIPGTSKHHSGYALDFRYPDGTFGQFRSTPDYAWLAADNFLVAKRHGLIPSYPDDVVDQGPNPEPWEFVWVGVGLIRCGLPQDLATVVTGPAAAILSDIEGCPGGPHHAVVPVWLEGLGS
jgi:LAS superfamily LD-carboxypeptidase LdcB